MKSIWIRKTDCTGCGACANSCPKNAIVMQADETGFLYPSINSNCIECNCCEKICNCRGSVPLNHWEEPLVYAAWSKDNTLRFNSTSGGVFSELVIPVIKAGGSVAGAQYNEKRLVEHVLVSDLAGLERIRQSKYIQSDSKNIYSLIESGLKTGKKIVFCGTPCQVAALYAYLGKDYSSLFTIDFICRGVNSPKAFTSWLHELETVENSKISRIWFKYKDGGWKSSPKRTRLDFEDGHCIVLEGNNNLFMVGYLSTNLYMRPSCSNCGFKGAPRQGDITLADFWGIEKSLDDDKGTSLVLINSEKGAMLFKGAKTALNYYERKLSEIFAGNTSFSESVSISKKSGKFLIALDHLSFSTAIKKYSKQSVLSAYWGKVKQWIGKKK